MESNDDSISKLRLLGEVFVVIIAFTVFTMVIGLLFFRIQAGYGPDAVAMTTNEGREMVALATLFTTPLTLFCTVLTIEFILQSRGTDIESFGTQLPKNWTKTIFTGILLAILFAGLWFVMQAVNITIAEDEPTQYFDLIRGNGVLYFFSMTAVAWFAAGFAEEVIFRGFFMNNFVGIFGNGTIGTSLAVIIQALFYTGFHATDSLVGMIPVFVIGLLMGVIYFALGRRLWPLIIAHGLVVSAYFTNMYFGISG